MILEEFILDKLIKDYETKRNEINKIVMSLDTGSEHIKPITDGIINISDFLHSKYRVLWILKEPNDLSSKNGVITGGNWDLCNTIGKKSWIEQNKSVNGRVVFRRLSLCSDYILNMEKVDVARTDEDKWKSFKKTAYINIKKIPGLSAVSDKVIEKAYNESKNILHDQISNIDPQIIIGCNTLSYFSKHFCFDLKNKVYFEGQKKRGYYILNDKLYIDTVHPLSWGESDTKYLNNIKVAFDEWENYINKKNGMH